MAQPRCHPCLVAVVLATSLRGALAAAQTTSASATADTSGGRPVIGPARAFTPPRAESRTLPNGLRVVVVENHALPIVAVRMGLDADSRFDPAGKEGVSTLARLLLREGSATLPAAAFGDSLLALGMPGMSESRFTTVTSKLNPTLALFADRWTHPGALTGLDRYKALLLRAKQAAQNANAASSSGAPRRTFVEAVYGAGHPFARHMTEASIAAITSDDIASFRDRYFHPQNATLILVGDVRTGDIMPIVARAFGAWSVDGDRATPRPVPAALAPSATTIILVDRPGARQSAIVLGTAGPAVDAPDFVPDEVLNVVFGGGETSRLSQALRGQHGWTYNARSAYGALTTRGPGSPTTLIGYADVATAKTDSALVAWIAELRALRGDRPVTTAEMRAAQAVLTDGLAAGMSTNDLVADHLALVVQRRLPLDFDQGYVTRARALTPQQITEAAARYLDPAHLTIVVYGDRQAIGQQLEAAGIGPVTVR